MRVGKKPNVVQAKKTRSCVVRLEKVRPSLSSKTAKATRSAVGGKTATPVRTTPVVMKAGVSAQRTSGIGIGSAVRTSAKTPVRLPETKQFKGPLKKRPVTEISMPTVTPKSKDKEKEKGRSPQKVAKTTPIPPAVVDETPPPTIAAGRSRRAIKPNPKYASEDMVTPKSIKYVGGLSTSGNKKSSTSTGEKQRKPSASSSDDFFNKESSEETDEDLNETPGDKPYKAEAKDSDSDFSDIELDEMPVVRRGRGRPRKIQPVEAQSSGAPSGTPVAAAKSAAAVKSTPSQLQQLRKTLEANVNRVTGTPADRKRRLESSMESEGEISISRKRFMMAPSGLKLKTASVANKDAQELQINHKSLAARKSLSSQTLNGNKLINPQSASGDDSKSVQSTKEKLKTVTDKIASKLSAKALPKRSQNPIMLAAGGAKQRTSPAVTPKAAKSAEKAVNEGKKLEESPSSTVDDFETMPTFTIVNINDIINKKGDVLISKTGNKNSASKSPKADSPKAPNSGDTSAAESKLSRRKTGHTTILSEKLDPDRSKNPLPRTPFPQKKMKQTILNHTLLNKSEANQRGKRGVAAVTSKASGASLSKPAPRILNSMVAKKTQPVKPMIANLDDSADESYPLSLDDEEDVEDMDVDDEDEDDPTSFVGKQRKLPSSSSTPFLSNKKKTAPATKENSLAATNRLPERSAQRKLSPEKVVISRQGDKIIKKITCFETWYVINVPEDQPAKVVRNILEIPLINLANAAESTELPSDCWSSKVTLYELSATTIAKSNLITYTGDLKEHNITENDRDKFQPSCVMFRRAVSDRLKSRLPYDRAVIFKNKTFFTNIEGKNVKLIGAPTTISTQEEVEILLQVVDSLTLQSAFVEPATTVQ